MDIIFPSILIKAVLKMDRRQGERSPEVPIGWLDRETPAKLA